MRERQLLKNGRIPPNRAPFQLSPHRFVQSKTAVGTEDQLHDTMRRTLFQKKSSKMNPIVEGQKTISDLLFHNNSKLYDREIPKEQILDVFHKCCGCHQDGSEQQQQQQQLAYNINHYNSNNNQTTTTQRQEGRIQIAVISGASGMGKTVLAKSIQSTVESEGEGGFFISGKFDQFLRETEPYSAFATAFNKLLDLIIKRNDKTLLAAVEDAMHNLERNDVDILLEVIPNLSKMLQNKMALRKDASDSEIDNSSTYNSSGGLLQKPRLRPNSQQRFAYAFSRILRSIYSPTRPILLFLDDLQWADKASLKVLTTILLQPVATDYPETRTNKRRDNDQSNENHNYSDKGGLMIIATCRENEVEDEDLRSFLHTFEGKNDNMIGIKIKMENLGVGSLSEMISDIVGLPKDQCALLAKPIFDRTQGNPFFAKQYIQNLSEGELKAPKDFLSVDLIDLLDLLTAKLKRLPLDVQEIMKVASCLGSSFEIDVLSKAAFQIELLSKTVTRNSSQYNHLLMSALQLGIRRGIMTYDDTEKKVSFSHDKFQEAAKSLINHHERSAFYLNIGRNLRYKLDQVDRVKYSYLIVNLLRKGAEKIDTEKEREDVAILSLETGKKAVKSSAFNLACDYMELGISLLRMSNWQDQYELSVDLYNSAAEMEYCTGNHERVDSLTTEITLNSRTFDDEIQARVTKIMSLGASRKAREAFNEGFVLLKGLGHPFPKRVNKFDIMVDLFKTKQALRRKTEPALLNLPWATDRGALASMTVLNVLHTIAATSRLAFTHLIACRLVRLTLKYGMCSTSFDGFSMYGGTLVRMGDISEGYKYERFALRLNEKYPSIEIGTKILLGMATGSMPANEPFRNATTVMENASRSGLQLGDIENSMRALGITCAYQFFIGFALPYVTNKIRHQRDLCIKYGQKSTNPIVAEFYKASLKLMDHNSNIEVELSSLSLKTTNPAVLVYTLYVRFMLAIYLNDSKSAEIISKKLRNLTVQSLSVLPFFRTFHAFYEGIFAASQFHSSRRHRRLALKQLKVLKNLSKFCSRNVMNKIYLIEAEIEASADRYVTALIKYDKSINFSEEEGFIHESALACEKAGHMLLRANRATDAMPYMSRARDLYTRWGANVKVEELTQQIKESIMYGTINFC